MAATGLQAPAYTVSRLIRTTIVILAITVVSPALAQDEKGIYERLDLRKREPHDLIETSAQYNGLFERRSLIFENEEVVKLVRRIGSELAPPPTDDYIDYQFFVLRDPSPNAFAFPNGHIYVHTGMLARMADESQLAALLAHEITHVAGHHSILSHRITATRLAIQVFSGGLGALLGQLRYSRKLEQEADDRAPLLLRESAYDSHAMPELLEILDRDFEGVNPRYSTVWATHPDPRERILLSLSNVSGLPERDRDPIGFDSIIYSLRALTTRDYIQDDYPHTAIALAQNFLERYPDDLEFRMLLGDAWHVLGARSEFLPEELTQEDARHNFKQRITRTRAERLALLLETEEGQAAYARNLDESRRTYEDILDRDPEYAAAHRGLGEVYESLGQHKHAGRSYLEYVRAAPNAEDRPIIIGRLAEIRDLIQKQESSNE